MRWAWLCRDLTDLDVSGRVEVGLQHVGEYCSMRTTMLAKYAGIPARLKALLEYLACRIEHLGAAYVITVKYNNAGVKLLVERGWRPVARVDGDLVLSGFFFNARRVSISCSKLRNLVMVEVRRR